MVIADHVEKIARIEAARARLDPIEDYELWYFATLFAAIHAVNAALHAIGVTRGEDCFAHNAPVFFRRDPASGDFEAVINTGGDLEHVEGDEAATLFPSSLEDARRAVVELEEMREPSVRGTLRPSADVVARVEAAYGACRRVTAPVIESAP